LRDINNAVGSLSHIAWATRLLGVFWGLSVIEGDQRLHTGTCGG
jgi:hypothetical protein